MATKTVGYVVDLSGSAQVRTADGVIKVLNIGDTVSDRDLLMTGDGANAVITFYSGQKLQVAGNEEVLLDDTVYAEVSTYTDEQVDEVASLQQALAAMQQAILEAEDVDELDATAAGVDKGSPEALHQASTYERDGREGEVETRLTDFTADVQGIDNQLSGDDNIIVVAQPEAEPPIIPTPVAATTNVPVITVTANNVVEESVSVGDVIATYSSSDADGDSLTHQLINDPGGYFILNGNNVELTAAGVAAINNDVLNLTNLTIEVEVSDGANSAIGNDSSNITRISDVSPVALGDSYTTDEDTVLTINLPNDVLVNDSDLDGDALSVNTTPIIDVTHGTLILNTDGTFTYTPDIAFIGSDSFVYEVNDGNGGTAQATVDITVNPTNDAPVAMDDSVSAIEDTVFNSTLDLDANDTDLDGDALSVVAGTFATTQGGSITIAADGSYSYTPAANFNGVDSVDYTVTDGNLTDVGTLTINVTAVNDAPVAVDDAITAIEDTVLNSAIELDTNDTDLDGDSLSVVAGTFATMQGGSITIAADGSYSYTPAANFNGVDTVDYTVTDGNLTDVGTLTINITAVNDAPVAVDDAVTTTEDTIFTSTIDLDANDTDLDGDALSVVAGTYATTQGGSITIVADGSYTYTPAVNFNGVDTVDYTVTDGNLTDVGTLTINVTAVNDAPVAVDDAITATEDTVFTSAIELDANDTDLDGDALSVVAGTFATVQGGSITIAADGSYSYTPAANFNGVDTVDYSVTDGNLTDVGTLTINVTAVNDAPVAVDDAVTVTEDTVFNSVIDLDDNDTDLDGDSLSVVAGTYATTQGGSITVVADGSYTYTPAVNFNGVDTVDYTVTDGNLTDVGTLTINVTAVNDAPVADDDAVTATEDTVFNSVIELDANDTDLDGDVLSVVAGTYATTQGGSITIAADGSYSYTPAANFNGVDSVDYTVTDGSLSDVGTLTINVIAVNDAPVAVDDAVTTSEDAILNSTIDLDINDTDLDGDALGVVAGTFATVQGGSITIAADGSYSYTPAANFNGVDTVDYTVTDGNLTDVGTLTINVAAVNDAPVAVDDVVTTAEDTVLSLTIELDANDTDLDGDALSVVAGTYATNQGGSITIAADGSYSYTPAANFNGVDTVDYTVTDGSLTDVGTLTINVTAVNDAPVAMDDAVTTSEDAVFSSVIELDANDSDLDGDALSVVAGTFATNQGGSITIAADGSYTYTPAANFNGVDSVDYTVTDGSLSDMGILTINVIAVNDAPVAVDDAVTATEDTVFNSAIELDANDTDLDGDALSVVAGTYATTQGGSITIAADGSYSYTPLANFNGVDSVDYTVTDGSLSDVGTLTINVTAVNDAPVAVDDSVTAIEDTVLNSTIELDFNDTDLDGDMLNVVAGTYATAQGGSITIATDGSYSYTPAPNFNGFDSVDYTVTDGNLIDSGTLTINVTAVNDAPVAVDDVVTTTEDVTFNSVIELDANDIDLDGDALSVVAGTYATTQGGSITIAADGSYSYTPAPNFNGVDSVDYTVTDGSLTDVGTLSINVNSGNDAPIAIDDAVTATEDAVFNSTIELDANDTDLDGDVLSVVAGTFATSQGGSITIASDGSYTYTPAANFNGVDTVDYTVTDGSLTDVGTLTINVTAVNDAPLAVDDAVTATEDTVFNSVIDLDANDTDLDGDSLSVVAGTYATTQGGSITISADGSYSYTPAANFNGVDSVDYTVTDGSLTDVGTLTMNVTAVNDAPVAVDDAVTSAEDTVFNSTIDLDANDTDLDGDALSVVAGTFATTQGGSITIAADGSYTYTPASNFNGVDSVDYTVTDGDLTDVGTLTINVTAVNDAPVAVDDSVTIAEDTVFNSTIELDSNDTDLDGDALSVVAGTFATTQGGSITIAADGSYTYTPASNFNGVDIVNYTVTDGNLSAVGTLTINVTAVNDAPVAVDDAVTATEDTVFNSMIELGANDTDLDGDALSVVAGTYATTQGGSITIAADGSYTYTPAANFNGVDSVDYTVTDGSLSDVGTLTINVTAVNDAPVAMDDAVTTAEDTVFSSVIELDANDTDLDGDALSVVAGTFATAQGGSITIAADGNYTYTPAENFNGVDSVDYTVTDGSLSDVGTLTINVTAVNDAPVAVDDSATATEDTVFNSAIDLDANDTDLDGDALSVVAGTYATTQGGSITIAADGSYSYTPAANFNGVDFVDYTVTDGSLTDVGTLTINVTAVNDAPVAVDDAVTATEDTVFTSAIELDANDTDLDGDALSVVAGTFATVQGGSITIAADGSYSYTPAANFNGVDTVDYSVTDGNLTDVGTLTINVTAVNDAPVAVDDAVTTAEDTVFNSTIDLDANDTDLDGDALSVVAGTYATTQGGSIVIAADGSYSYTPAANFNGVDTVDYTVTDGSLSDVGTLTINVTAVNDAPVAVDDAVTATEDTVFNSLIDLDANDTDLDGDALSVVAGTYATTQGGSITIAADGSYSYTPAPNFNGVDSVDYTVTDGSLSDVGTLTINVTAVNDAPVAVDDSVTATEDTVLNSAIDLDANDTDLDGDSLSVVAGTFATVQGGSITIAADGSYSYTPAANFNGVDSVDYTVTDGSLTDVGTLTINVTAVNDAPVANDDSVTASEDAVFNSVIDLDANDTDLDGDSLSVVAGTFATSQGGSITIASDGSYTYTPAANFNGVDSVDYTVTDGSLTDVGTLTINVTAVNDAPVAVDDAVTATEDTVFNSTIDLDANDTDLDGDALSVVAGTYATTQGGSITIAADGSYSYTPAVNFNGVDTVDYTVTDGSLSDVGTLTMNVTAVNDAPVAVDDAVTSAEDTVFNSTIDLDANDTDLDGDALSVVAGTFATTQGGSITIAADGSYTYTPASNFNGVDSVDYTVTDGDLTDVGTLTINVTAVNDAPVAVDDSVTIAEDTVFNSTIELDSNDTDLDGDALSVVAGTFATTQGGSITIAADGSYTYTPASNFNGVDIVNYTVTDGNLSAVGTLTINVTAVNDAPVAVDDAVTATEDTVFNSMIELGANDTDLDGDALSVVAGTYATTQGGSITIAADGSYTYTPAANFNGVDSVDYTVTDGSLSDVGTLTINVTAVNDAPVAMDDAVTTAEDTVFSSVIELDANDTDLDGDALSVVAGTFATAQGGSITIAADGNYTYTPAENFNGVDSVDYTVTDGSLSDVGTLTINVTAVNDAPVAVDDSATATEDTVFNSAIDLDANDTDLDGDALSVVAGTYATTQGGSITIAADGSYSYTPAANFNGVDFVDYTVTDGSLTDVGTLTINVTAVNDAPVAVDDAVTATEDTVFTSAIELDANDTDLDGDALSVVAGTFATVQGGSITIAADGSYSYTPAANFNGVDTVDYSVTDGNLTDVGTLTINVTAVNDAPVAVDDAVTTAEDTVFNSTIDLDANDTDLDGDALSVVAGTYATTQGGSIVIAADGSYSYTPAANFNGVDTVDYTVTDGSLSDVGTLTINVTAVNDAPVAVDDAVTATEDTVFNSVIDLDTNDTDLDGDALSVVAGTFATTQGGSITIAADGSYSYTPAANFNGVDTVDYTVTDGNLTDVGTLTINVTAVNDAPLAVDDAVTATEDTVFNSVIDLDANDTDLDGDSLSVVAGTYATTQGGSITIAADGSYTYTPAANFNGVDSVDYTVTDGSLTDVGTLTINVTAVNDAPVAVDDEVTATEDTVFNSAIDLDANDTDLDGDALSVVAGTYATTQGGSITIAADGSYSYTPAPNFNGVDSVDYTVTDGSLSDVGTLTINVTAVNDAPVAVDDSVTATEDTVLNSAIDLDANDTDIDGDSLSVVAGTFATVQGGSITIAADGSYSYTPAANFNGVDSVDYTVTDGSLTDVGTLTINVTAVNDAPVANDDSVTASEDAVFNSVIDLDANDTDLDGDALSVVAGTYATTQGGSITIAADGSYSYTPAVNFNGVDTVDYTVTDGSLSDVGTLTINVTAVNDVPVAVDDSVTATEDTVLNSVIELDANDTDIDGDALSVVAGTYATTQGGSIMIAADGSYSYTPAANFNGIDSVDYTVTDGSLTDVGTLTINVTAVNDAPVLDLDANDDSGAAGADYITTFTEGGTAVSIADVDVAINDVDSAQLQNVTITITNVEAGDLLNAGSLPAGITASAYDPVSGSLTLSGNASLADYQTAIRSIQFINDGSSAGSTRSIEVSVSDSTSSSNVAVTTVNVVTLPTVSIADVSIQEPAAGTAILVFTVALDQALASDLTFDYSTVDISAMAGSDYTGIASSGTILAGDTTATITVTVNSDTNNFEGDETFSVDLSNFNQAVNFASGSHLTADGVQGIGTIGANNGAPDAVDDSYITEQGTPLVINGLLDNDVLVDGATLTGFTQGVNGSVVDNGDGTYTYTPDDPGFAGTDTFTYTLTDADGEVDTATVTVTVSNTAVNPPAVSSVPDTSYTENDAPTQLLSGVSISDIDSTSLGSVVVRIDGYIAGQDNLTYLTAGTSVGASVSVVGNVWELTLTGGADINEYQSVLGSLEYENLSDNPSSATRSITVEAYDETYNNLFGADAGNLVITPVNDAAEVFDNNNFSATGAQDNALNITAPTDMDTDDAALVITVTGLPASVGTVTLADGTPVNVNDVLTLDQLTTLEFDAGVTDGTGTFIYSVFDGELTTVGTTTINVGSSEPDVNTVYESAMPGGTDDASGLNVASGNLFANDAAASGATTLDSIDFNAGNYTPDGSGIITIITALGTLTVYADNTNPGYSAGDYIYTLDTNDTTSADVSETFTYNFTSGSPQQDTLTIDIIDDAPVANDLVEIIPESEEKVFNIIFTLDDSGSMDWGAVSGSTNPPAGEPTRMEIAQESLSALATEYFNQSTQVTVTLITFNSSATLVGTYTDFTSFETALNSVTAGGGTNYVDATDEIQTQFTNDLATQNPADDVQNISYFISDGEANAGTSPVGSGYTGFVNDNSIDSYAVGIGSSLPSDLSDLNYIHNIDSMGVGNGHIDEALIVADVSQLEAELLSTVPTAFGGNIVANGSIQNIAFGADGGYVQSIEMDMGTPATTYTFNYDGSNITVSPALPTIDIDGSRLTLNSDDGFSYGTFTFDFSDGSYSFIAPNGTAEATFNFDYTIIDGDGDTTSATATINIVDDVPDARDDLHSVDAYETAQGNVITAIGTDGGPTYGDDFTPFATQGAGVDKIVDDAVLTEFSYRGSVISLDLTLTTTLVMPPDPTGTSANVAVDDSTDFTATDFSLGSTSGVGFNGNGAGVSGGRSDDKLDDEDGGVALTITFDNSVLPYGVDNLVLEMNDYQADKDAVTLELYDSSGSIIATVVHSATSGTSIDLSAYSGIASVDMTYTGSDKDAQLSNVAYDPAPASLIETTALDQTGGDNGSNLSWVYSHETDLDGNDIFQATVMDSDDGSSFIMRSNGYYNFTPDQTDGPVDVSVDTTSQANVDASDLNISIRAGGTTLQYSGDGVGVEGGNGQLLSSGEALLVSFDAAALPNGVDDLVLTLNDFQSNNTDQATVIVTHDTDGNGTLTTDTVVFSATNAGSETLDLSQFSGVTQFDIEYTGGGWDLGLGNVSYQVPATGGASMLQPEPIDYTLTDSDGQKDTARLTIYTVDQIISGTAGADNIVGGSLNDAINGETGNDILSGGDGHDTVSGSEGSDILYGNAGNDYLSGGADNDSLFGGADNDYLDGDAGDDLVDGGTGDDIVQGGDGDDSIYGGAGNDKLEGEDGYDLLVGGAGDDSLFGGSGVDILYGGAGNDELTGGGDVDTFVWSNGDEGTEAAPAMDVIHDFTVGVGGDVLNLADILQGENTGNLTEYLHFESDGNGGTVVKVDSDGGGTFAETQQINLTGVDLTAGGAFTDQNILDNLLADGNLIVD